MRVYPKEYNIENNPKLRRVEFYQKGKLKGYIRYEEMGLKKTDDYTIKAILNREWMKVAVLENPKDWSRKEYQNERKKEIEVGKVYEGVISATSKFGIFVDILGDVDVYVNCSQTSRTFNFPPFFFKKGEKVEVKIIEKKQDSDGRILLNGSRKEVESQIDVKPGKVFSVRIARAVEGGYFCELAPNIQGIVDTLDDLKEGEEIVAIVKRISENNHIHMVMYDYYS